VGIEAEGSGAGRVVINLQFYDGHVTGVGYTWADVLILDFLVEDLEVGLEKG